MKFKNISTTTVDGAAPGEFIELDPDKDADRARRLVKRCVIAWDDYLPVFVRDEPKAKPVKTAAKKATAKTKDDQS